MSHFSVEKLCHLPSSKPDIVCVILLALTGGNEEESLLLSALSCTLLSSQGREMFGQLETGKKSRAMVILCV